MNSPQPQSFPTRPVERQINDVAESQTLDSQFARNSFLGLAESQDEGERAPLPAIDVGRWGVLGVLGSAVAVLLLIAIFGRIDIVSTATGGLRTNSGPRPVRTRVAGKVVTVAVKPGDHVAANQIVAEVQATELEAGKIKDAAQLSFLREEQRRSVAAALALRDEAVAALQRKRALLGQRAKVKAGVRALRSRRASQLNRLAIEGAASKQDAQTATVELAETGEQLLVLQQQIAEVDIDVADRRGEYRRVVMDHERRVSEAELALAEANTISEVGQLRAPEAGVVESLSVVPTQVVDAGALVARIVPNQLAPTAVVFAPAKDAAFLQAGQAASLEFASLPISEYGRAHASVTRVGSDIASAAELSEVLGEASPGAEPLVRVELGIADSEAWRKMTRRLQPGARVIARVDTRERRLITLFFDFLLKWLPS